MQLCKFALCAVHCSHINQSSSLNVSIPGNACYLLYLPPCPCPACLPACCQLCKQTKEAATSAAATTTFPFLYSAATLPMTSDRERTESRQARLDNLYVATATVATVYLNVLVCVFVVRVLCVLDFQYFTTSVVGSVLFCSVLLLRNCLVSYITQLWQHLQHKDNRTNKRQIDWHLPTLQFPHAPRSPHHHFLSLSDLTTAQAV